jgi:hypothetical protein
MMRLLRWLIVAAGLSLFTLSLALHYRIDTYLDYEAPPAAPTIAPDGMVRVELFGLEQKLAVRVFDNRTDAEHACGKDDVIQWHEIPSRRRSTDGKYSCHSDWRPSAQSRRGF